jgi:hypothetical protein
MRALLAVVAVLAFVAAATACSDDDESAEPTVAAVATDAPTTSEPRSTPEPNGTASAETIEVQGVVGAVDTRAGTIEIRATGGSSITTIELAPGAEVTRLSGPAIQLADIRPSDRIVARGVAGADPEILVADTVTVQQVVPGGPPGANPGG